MSLNRSSQHPDIIQTMKDIERWQREKKENQIVGADAVKTFLVQTEDRWDWIGKTYFEGSAKIKRLRVSFEPEKSTTAALKLQTAHEIVGYPTAPLTINSMREPVVMGQPQNWDVTIIWFGDQELRVKFFVSSTGKGRLSVI